MKCPKCKCRASVIEQDGSRCCYACGAKWPTENSATTKAALKELNALTRWVKKEQHVPFGWSEASDKILWAKGALDWITNRKRKLGGK